jgi:cell division control protein 6
LTQVLIFRNPEGLSPRFVPDRLPHRDDTLKELAFIFRRSFESPEKVNLKVLQLIGPSGSGKTSTLFMLRRILEKDASLHRVNFKFVYVNLKVYAESRVLLYRYIVESIAPEISSRNLSAGELLYRLLRYLSQKNLYVVLALDELESYLDAMHGDTSILYDLSRLNESTMNGSSHVLGVLFTARSLGFHKKLDEAELSTLGTSPILFRRYTSSEIKDILLDRIPIVFNPERLSEGVIDYVSNIAAEPPYNGNARHALDLLYDAGNYAERQGANKLIPDHVRFVVAKGDPAISQEDIENLPTELHLLALLAVVITLQGRARAYSSLMDIRAEAEVLEISKRKKGLASKIEDLVQDLADRGILEVRSLREIGINGVPLEKLESFLDTLFDRLERKIKKK